MLSIAEGEINKAKLDRMIESKSYNYSHMANIQASFDAFFSSGGINIDTRLSKLMQENSIKGVIIGGPFPLLKIPSLQRAFLIRTSRMKPLVHMAYLRGHCAIFLRTAWLKPFLIFTIPTAGGNIF